MKPHLVALDRDHPGFRDLTYRTRRDAIASVALAYTSGPVPDVEYSDDEHGVWGLISQRLRPLHDRLACAAFLHARDALGARLPQAHVPQFAQVNQWLEPTAFTFAPVAGLMTPRGFLEQLADGVFLATQYIRHASAPFYTPEPDIVHEVIGHAILLTDPEVAELHRDIGRAARRATAAQVEALIRIYWYGLEFGLVREPAGGLRAVGAGLLSSFGELERCLTDAHHAPFDLDAVAATDFDPTQYQSTLFVADSQAALFAAIRAALP